LVHLAELNTAMLSEPCFFLISESLRATKSSASSQPASRKTSLKLPSTLRSLPLSFPPNERLGQPAGMVEEVKPKTAFNAKPALVDRALLITLNLHDLITADSEIQEHPTPQYGHMVLTRRVGCLVRLGIKAPVGHRAMHSPQDSQIESRIGLSPKVLTLRRIPPECQVDGAHASDLLAGAHAPGTKNTFVGVAVKSRVTSIYRKQPGALAQSG
jgi:hypothetical protein